jgi:hypothetical protein
MKVETMRVCVAVAVLQGISFLEYPQTGQRLTPPFFVNQPFTQSSPFNIELPKNPQLDPNSSAIITALNSMSNATWALPAGTTGWVLELAATPSKRDFTYPVYFSTYSDPVYTIDCNGCTLQGIQINIPSYSVPENDSADCTSGDHHIAIINPAYAEYDMWEACPPNGRGGTFKIGYGGYGHLYGPYEDMGITTDTMAYGGGQSGFAEELGGVRAVDISQGAMIPHALQMQIPCAGNTNTANPYRLNPVWPAQNVPTDQACSNDFQHPPFYGMRVQLNMTDAQIQALHLPAYATSVLLTLEHYGAFVSDTGTGGDMQFVTESGLTYTQLGLTDPWVTLAQQNGIQPTNGVTDNGDYTAYLFTIAAPGLTQHLRVIAPCVTWGTC